MDELTTALTVGLRPHLPPGATATVNGTALLVRLRAEMQPAQGYGATSVLRYDLKEIAGDSRESDQLGAALWMLSNLQAELSEWLGRRWPPFPEAAVADGATPAAWHIRCEADRDRYVVGFRSSSGWSLEIAEYPRG